MKIGFDAKRITHNATGLGNYGRFVLTSLASSFPGNEYILYTINSGRRDLYSALKGYPSIQFHFPPLLQQTIPSIWRSRTILKNLKNAGIDLYHGLSNELPIGIGQSGIPTVVTIHDLIYLRYPHNYPIADRWLYSMKYRRACREASLIIAASMHTKEDIIRYWNIDERKIKVIYQGCRPRFQAPVTDGELQAVRMKYNITAPYILNVGTIEERKNLLTLVQAIHLLNEPDIKLIVIGRPTAYYKKVRAYVEERSLQDRIRIYHSVSSSDLPALYRMADLFVYPSRYEGFGIPILEALASQTPVIAATGSCLEETGGPSSLYVDPDDPHQLAEHIRAVISDSSLASRMRNDGRLHAQQFSPEEISGQLMALYSELLNGK